jgi:hypothetical protein
MKKAILLTLLVLNGICLQAQNLTAPQKAVVTNFINAVKSNDKDKLAALVAFPLKRQYPIPSIKNKQEFKKRFDEVFDIELLKAIKTSDVFKDWYALGYQGIILERAEVWLNEDGKLSEIYYESAEEAKMRKTLIAAEKKMLHASVKEFKAPELILLTAKYRIRIDQMADDTYRYAAWKLSAKMSDTPDIVIEKGTLVPDGTGGNYHYTFAKGDYSYECGILTIGADDSPPATLTVYKGEKEVLYQDATILEP